MWSLRGQCGTSGPGSSSGISFHTLGSRSTALQGAARGHTANTWENCAHVTQDGAFLPFPGAFEGQRVLLDPNPEIHTCSRGFCWGDVKEEGLPLTKGFIQHVSSPTASSQELVSGSKLWEETAPPPAGELAALGCAWTENPV